MAKKSTYVCSNCGAQYIGYMGKCTDCGEFGTLVEQESNYSKQKKVNAATNILPKKLKDVEETTEIRINTGLQEVDRVFGGGIVKGSVNALIAPPGLGKSSLAMSIAGALANKGYSVYYYSGEESESQIKLRAKRILKDIPDNIFIKTKMDVDLLKIDAEAVHPDFLIIDSVQTLYSNTIDGVIGGEKQCSYATDILLDLAKRNSRPITQILISQVTKEDTIRGSREFEHMVDAVIVLESSGDTSLRFLKNQKNRFASTDELGLFLMTDSGLEELKNPNEYFLTTRNYDVSGVALTVVREGLRTIVLEIECLTEYSQNFNPSRVSKGISQETLKIILAITNKVSSGLNLKNKDVYMQVSGGFIIKDGSVGMSVVSSLYSACKDICIPNDYVFLGEVSLTGDFKKIKDLEYILKELDRLGFKKCFIPKNALNDLPKYTYLEIVEVSSIKDLISKLNELKKEH